MQKAGDSYDREFFNRQIAGSTRSAAIVVPKVLKLFPGIKSVVDVGCGSGVWLSHFHLNGVPHILGVDAGNCGDLLQIGPDQFRNLDLSRGFDLLERFDLAVSLEVAEHLPPASAALFVDNLCRHSDRILFSAAIPGQTGTDHVNEQWQNYWISLFASRGYVCLDVLRPDLWYDNRCEWWYMQNILVFLRESETEEIERLRARERELPRLWDAVHPRCFEQTVEQYERVVEQSIPMDQVFSIRLLLRDLTNKYEEELVRRRKITNSTIWKIVSPLHRLERYFHQKLKRRKAAKPNGG